MSGASFVYWHEVLCTVGVGVLCNVSCALLGCYLVLRRMSLLGDAISHAVLPGIALGFLFAGSKASLPLFAGAAAMGVLTAVLTQTLHHLGRVPEDASMGVVFTSLFAVGVLLIKLVPQVDLDPGCVFYGMIDFAPLYTLGDTGVWQYIPRVLPSLALACAATLLFVGLLWKELKIASFDPQMATAVGVNATLVHYLLMGMVAAVTVAAFEAVGSVLVIAMLIVPAATAHLLADRLGWMMLIAAAVAALAAVVGYAGAKTFNTYVAGMMAVAAGLFFLLAVLAAPRHGLVSKAWHNLALALRIAREDVLAMLYRAEEKADAPATVEQCRRVAGGGLRARLALAWLRHGGEIEPAAAGELRLTARGRDLARSVVRSHRLWEAYLSENFELPLDHLHGAAERLEHFIGPALQQELEQELRQPQTDPHGQPIPSNPPGKGAT